MTDVKRGLPVRTLDDTHYMVQTKIYDPAGGTNYASCDSDYNLHVEIHGNKPDTSDVVMRLSELGAPNPDGDYDASNNSKPASIGLVGHDRGATIDETSQNKRVTAVAYATDNVIALDVAIRDEDGEPWSDTNPLPTYSVDDEPGTEVHDYDEAVDVTKDGGTANHDYSVAEDDVFSLHQLLISSSLRCKAELQIGDGAVSEVFATKAVFFFAEAQNHNPIPLKVPIKVVGTANTTTVRLIKTNLDKNSDVSIYSTIIGRTA